MNIENILKIKKIVKSKNAKNSFWIIGERIIQMIISFAIAIISARYLGPSNYGILTYGTSLVAFFVAIVKMGLDSIIVKELINNLDSEGEILGTSILFRVISSILSIGLIFCCVVILKPNEKIILITTMLQSVSLIFQAMSFLDYWFQTKLKSKYVSIAKIISYTIACLYKVYLLVNKYSVEWFAVSSALDHLIICIFLFVFYKKNDGQKLKVDFKLGISLLKKSYHFIISGLMIGIYTQIDKIMIGSILNETFVGYYSVAMAIHSVYSFLPDAVITSVRPTLFELQGKNNKLYIKRLKQTFCLIFWGCMILAFGISVFAKFAVKLLYGVAYLDAVTPLIILVWAVPFSYLGNVRGIWTIGEGLQKYIKRYLTLGAIMNMILNYFLLKVMGILGAAIATLITEIFVGLFAPLLYKDTRAITKIMIDSILFKFNNQCE